MTYLLIAPALGAGFKISITLNVTTAVTGYN
jgi:hypothetical protein